jgi:hypothetical protein
LRRAMAPNEVAAITIVISARSRAFLPNVPRSSLSRRDAPTLLQSWNSRRPWRGRFRVELDHRW